MVAFLVPMFLSLWHLTCLLRLFLSASSVCVQVWLSSLPCGGLLLNPLLHCWMLQTIWHMLISLISFLTHFTPTLYSVMYICHTSWASLVAQLVKNPPAMQETLVQFLGQGDALEKGLATHSSILGLPWGSDSKQSACTLPGFDLWVEKIPWRRAWHPLQYSCLENSHGQRSLVGYSPWGLKELNMTERLSIAPCSIHHDFFFFACMHACNYYTAEQFPVLYLVSPITLLGLHRKYNGCWPLTGFLSKKMICTFYKNQNYFVKQSKFN